MAQDTAPAALHADRFALPIHPVDRTALQMLTVGTGHADDTPTPRQGGCTTGTGLDGTPAGCLPRRPPRKARCILPPIVRSPACGTPRSQAIGVLTMGLGSS
jgi:hypothetical protein